MPFAGDRTEVEMKTAGTDPKAVIRRRD